MIPILARDGYQIHREVLNEDQITRLKIAANRVAETAGSACVRHLRQRDPSFDELSRSELLLELLPPGLRPVRSILFDKTTGENWPVPWHQDLTIAVVKEQSAPGYGPWSHKDGAPHVQPPIELLQRMITIRLHLDDADETNGALRVIPKSHLLGRLSATAIREETEAQPAISCNCQAGDALLMHPLILHSSRRSAQPHRRRVLHFEYAFPSDLHPKLTWFEGSN